MFDHNSRPMPKFGYWLIALTLPASALQASGILLSEVDQTVANSIDLGPAPASTTGNHAVAVGPAGTWFRYANAYDSAATPTSAKSPGPLTGPYPTPIAAGGSTTGPISVTGTWYTATGTGCLTYGPGFWNSSCSSATILKVAKGLATESAKATAIASDPSQYQITFNPAFTPEVLFSLTFSPGMQLTSLGGPDFSSDASMTGDDETSLLSAPLWSWSWMADSANPNSSTFQFQSNPLLNLDDSSIEGAVMADITDLNGVHTIMNPLTITGSVFPDVANGSTLDYTFGGERTFEADAAVVVAPEPMTCLLLGTGLLLMGTLGKRRAIHRRR